MAERGARGAALVAMAVLAVRLWSGTTSSGQPQHVRATALDSALVAWSATPAAQSTIDGDATLGSRQRHWLVALRRTGMDIRWTTADTIGSALVVESGPLPGLPAKVVAVSPPGSAVTISDGLGRVDSATSGPDGVTTWRLGSIGTLRAAVGHSTASSRARDSIVTRAVLVIGEAGWETKFVAAALEEAGWPVITRMTVAPGAVVRQGADIRIDTASVSAVVILDSTAAFNAPDLARFVTDGGGLIAAGGGASHPALRDLLPARGARLTAEVGALLGPTPREGLPARTFRMSGGSVAIDRRGPAPVIVGRRVGSGRVLAVGYEDTWRLRMAPPDESAPEAHRAMWSSFVTSVANVRLLPLDVGDVDEAPVASTVAALGPPASGTPVDATRHWPWTAILAGIAAAALLGEWLSRRLRGVA